MELWRGVLRVERVGLDDNFFDIGGDSLLLVAVHSNLQKMLNIEIPVTDLFEFTTVRTLGKHLREDTQRSLPFQACSSRRKSSAKLLLASANVTAAVLRELAR